MRMDSITLVAQDNIEELLIKIVEFTNLRQQIITNNLENAQNKNYTPKCLETQDFADRMGHALAEYMQNDRLVFHDTNNIRFGSQGDFYAEPIEDKKAAQLRSQNVFLYLKQQRMRLLENSINHKVAIKLLESKRAKATSLSA